MPWRNVKYLHDLISVSTGEKEAEIFFKNGRIVNVYSGEILEGNVAVYGNRVAYVGPSDKRVGKETKIVDARNRFLIPGLIDAHCHPDLFCHPATFADWVVRSGTTTLLIDTHDMITAIGMKGLRQVMEDSLSYPVRAFFLAPVSSPPFPDIEGEENFDTTEMKKLLRNNRVLGVSEITPYPRLLEGDLDLLARVAASRRLGKRVEGHAVGASYEKLNSLIIAGLTSCHESITENDLLSRLRLGLYTMVRCGSIRNELNTLVPVLQDPRVATSHRVLFTPDGVFPDDLVKKGYMNRVMGEAMKLGLDPIQAIQMSSLHPALYLGMDRDLGAIAPGRFADILVLDRLDDPVPSTVMQDGRFVLQDGIPLLGPSPVPRIRDEGKPFLLRKAHPEMFSVKPPDDPSSTIPVISIVDNTTTRRQDLKLPVLNGFVQADPERDILKVAAFLRSGKKWNCGFVTGIGARFDALCSSVGHDWHEILVIGRNDHAMTRALDRLLEVKGGIIILKDNTVLCELRLPIGGTMSDQPMDKVAGEYAAVKETLRTLGSPLEDPLLAIIFLTFTSVVDIRITASGLYDVKRRQIIFDSRGGVRA